MTADALAEPLAGRSAWNVSGTLRAVLMVVPPLLLAVLEVFHPQPDQTAEGVMDVATWFLGFHLIQLVLIGPVALSVLLLADVREGHELGRPPRSRDLPRLLQRLRRGGGHRHGAGHAQRP